MRIQFDLPNRFTVNGITITIDRAWLESYGAHFLYAPIRQRDRVIGKIVGAKMDFEGNCIRVTAEINDDAVEGKDAV